MEALLISVAGGALGALIAYGGVRALVQAAPVDIPRLQSIGIDARVLFFSAAASITAGILFSLLPALRLTANNSSHTVKAAGRSMTATRAVSRLHQFIASSEIALCTVLLIAALLISQSLTRVLQTNAWANVSHVVTVNFSLPGNHYRDDSKRSQFYTNLLRAARSYPGVEAVGFTNALPFKGQMWGDDVNIVEDPKTEKDAINANWRFVSPDYFTAVGLPLLSGRYLTDSDSGRHLLLISERLAHQLPAGLNPVGAHVRYTPPGSKSPVIYEVAGVVADARAVPDEEPPFMVYVPYWDAPPWEVALVVRTSGDARSLGGSIQRLVRNTDNAIAIPAAQTLHDVLSKAVAPREFVTILGLLFAVSATFLAALGLYGLISLSTSQRTKEIGIRMAIGAQRAQIFRMMISQAVTLALIGLACGVAIAWPAARLLRSFLYGIKPSDPLTFAAVCAVLLAVSAAATFMPARRAAKVDPVRALKWE